MIRVENLVAAYDDTLVLDGVSLHVRKREIMVIMGQSGCGKSTLLRHMIGLATPQSGSVRIDGVDISNMNWRTYREFCRSVGVLFQSGGLFKSMTVGDNVAFPLREHTRLDEPVIRIVVKLKLDHVGLRGAENLMPAELSGGMKKRAGLARALALDPPILFLDEPTTGLDPIIGAGIDELILRLHKLYESTMVVVSHDVASGLRIADRIAIFGEKDLLELGTPQQIRSSANPYVQQFFKRQPPEEESADDLARYLI
ncbi:MAG: ABC transporter ATP-binding protein [Planctomycetes bacterium]|nr:ABC transporter ATP-binding protein [Planctomycetota bacterium]